MREAANAGAAASAGRQLQPAATATPPSPDVVCADERCYLDFSVKSPWEKAVASVEVAARRWLAMPDAHLAAESKSCDRPAPEPLNPQP